ncbi:MAG: chromosomal replication initiator protein DnaA [Cyanobacteria bacterium P01_H01_bin.15]
MPFPQQIWSQALVRLESQLSRPTFETWIKTATAQSLDAENFVLRTPNAFFQNHLQKNYLGMIAAILQDILGYSVEVKVITDQGDSIAFTTNDPDSNGSALAITQQKGGLATRERFRNNKLNPKYTFSRFVVGSNNRMAHAATLAVAESPGRDFNPLFLCGGVGLGKTHLMQAIGHYHLEIFPDSRVFYVSTEQFTNDLITAIRNDNLQRFREHYREADVLLVDDIQFIEGKEYTQEEFFHTFNTLHEAGKQVVLASDRPPSQIPTLEDRLVSRFSMGLIADIQVPDLETRMAILQKKAEYENVRLSREVIEYIASNYISNIRELEGALIRVMTYISISGLPMTVENITPILNTQLEKVPATPNTILRVVSETYRVSQEDLKSNSRRREISYARQIGMYLMRQYTDFSLPRIGELFGGKDHTTVMYSCDKIAKQLKVDNELNQRLRQLGDRIQLISRSRS